MLISVRVKPNSKKGDLILQTEEGLSVYLRAKPAENEANESLIRLLSEHYKVPKSRISIKRGQKSKLKVVEIL